MEWLDNPIQEYAWGSHTFLAELLGRPSPSERPQAELWIGAHPAAPSRLPGGASLADRIAADPRGTLGDRVADEFGPRLPFLLKVLAVARPLSLQVHPDRARAELGFAAEERANPPVRNYKDAWPKPEILCALTGFDALCGFREPAESADLLGALGIGALGPVTRILAGGDLGSTVRTLLDWPEGDREGLVAAVAERADIEWLPELARLYPADMGVVVALLLNQVRLAPGQAIYVAPGVPHCYLGGAGVELMANSDNVLRLGLTPKHVDVDELLNIALLKAERPNVSESLGSGEFVTPTREFRLSRLTVTGSVRLECDGPQLLLCMDGEVGGLRRGEAAFVPASDPPTSLNGFGTVYRATANSPEKS